MYNKEKDIMVGRDVKNWEMKLMEEYDLSLLELDELVKQAELTDEDFIKVNDMIELMRMVGVYSEDIKNIDGLESKESKESTKRKNHEKLIGYIYALMGDKDNNSNSGMFNFNRNQRRFLISLIKYELNVVKTVVW